MKRIALFFKNQWVLSLIGVTALGLIIWYGGEHIAIADSKPLESRFNRLLAIMVIVVLWGLSNMRARMKSSRNNSQLINELIMAPTAEKSSSKTQDNESAEEVKLLKSRFDDVLARLKKTSFQRGFGKEFLYELPWYVIIGPPGAGKTTLLENSGLEFPAEDLSKQKKVAGVGGTRHCDWWFSNQAVLIDTAGRYTTQDSYAEVDSGAWLGFLDLLKKHRRRRPLNGIIVAVSIEELIHRNEQQRERHAIAIRERIQELYSRTGTKFPIYFLFTKCDLIAGFSEYFDDLNKDQRTQVWGSTFQDSGKEAQNLPQYENAYEALLEQINQRVLSRLSYERDLNRRGAIYNFPQQLATLKPVLLEFIDRTFAPSRYETAPWLRGIYFTSGTQEGSPIDRVMGALSHNFGIHAQSQAAFKGHPKSYFITRLLQDVVFKEAELSSANVNYERKRLWLQRGAYATAAVTTLAVTVAWTASFSRNELEINKLNNRIDKYQQTSQELGESRDLSELGTALDYAQDLTKVFADTNAQTPWLMGMGLYQGLKLGNAAEQAYHRALHQWLLPHIKSRIERAISKTSDPEQMRRLLNLYVMLADPTTLKQKRFKPWVVNDWNQLLLADTSTKNKLVQHLDVLMQTQLPAMQLTAAVQERAQRIVCEIPLHNQIYDSLSQLAENMGLSPFSLNNLSREVQRTFNTGEKAISIAGFYTYDGFHKVLEKEGLNTAQTTIEENRRVCAHKEKELAKADAEQLLRGVREQYFKDYVDLWQDYVNALKLNNIRDLAHASDTLLILSAHNSPVLELLNELVRHTLMDDSRLNSLIDKFADKVDMLNQPADPIEHAFQSLHKLKQSHDDKPPMADTLIGQLVALQGLAAELAEASNREEAAFDMAKSRITTTPKDVIREMRTTARKLPAPFNELMTSAATQTWGTVLAAARSHINSAWQSTVLEEYSRRLENRYPLSTSSSQQMTLQDFGRFFGKDGSIDQFISVYLSPFIDTRRWRLRTQDDRKLALSNAAIKQLKRASRIKETYFQDNTQQPLVKFSMKPVFLDADVKRFTLDLSGQQINYRHGPARTSAMEWPGELSEDGYVRAVFERVGAGSFSITKDGPWAWFKLLDASTVDRLRSRDKLMVTFETAGLKARYQLVASSVANPFSNNELRKFRCPRQL